MIGKGSKVEFLSAKRHMLHPNFYPIPGTLGEVIKIHNGDTALVKWPEKAINSVTGSCTRFAILCDLRKISSYDYAMNRQKSAGTR
jgi:hypothetical protein